MTRRILVALVTLLGGGFVVAIATGVIEPLAMTRDGIALDQQPQWVTTGLGVALTLLVIGAGLWLVVKLVRGYLTLHGQLIGTGGSSPLLAFGIVSSCLIAACFGAALLLMGGTTSLWESGSGVTETVNELEEAGISQSVLEGDTVQQTIAGNTYSRCSQPSGTDSDGDRIPDEWERRGSTPGGAPLPDADPDRKDIYVQPIYADGAERFTSEEKQQLRDVWDRMSVSNPSGESGIALHFVDQIPNDGRVEGDISIYDDLSTVSEQYYNEETIGAGVCTYHLVAVGAVRDDSAAGYGESPGYVSIVESTRRPEYSGSVSFRGFITTHELLHNVVGRVDGDPHPGSGWLGGNNERLGRETRDELDGGFAPLG